MDFSSNPFLLNPGALPTAAANAPGEDWNHVLDQVDVEGKDIREADLRQRESGLKEAGVEVHDRTSLQEAPTLPPARLVNQTESAGGTQAATAPPASQTQSADVVSSQRFGSGQTPVDFKRYIKLQIGRAHV